MSLDRIIEPEVIHQHTVAAHDPPRLKGPTRLLLSVVLFLVTTGTVATEGGRAPHLVVIEGVAVRGCWRLLDINY